MSRDNQALLLSLGLGEPSTKPSKSAESLKKLQIAAKKRKTLEDKAAFTPDTIEEAKDEDMPRRKRPSLASTVASSGAADGSPLRRSSRSVRAIKRVADETFVDAPEDDIDHDEGKTKRRPNGEPQRLAKSLGKRTQNPYVPEVWVQETQLRYSKQFGHIPGVEVGRTWASRMECSTDAIHA
jgi:E3 ubiquitin-protein ligase UHRF1